MKASDELFQLIKSMTKAEKRSFKLDAALEAGQNDYVTLFDAIEKQTGILAEYDEEKLKQQLKKEKFVNRLYSIKNYLYNLVLKTLTEIHRDRIDVLKIDNLIHQALTLQDKKLYKQAAKILNKAKSLALELELHKQVLRILSLEVTIERFASSTKDYYGYVKKRFEEYMETAEKDKNRFEYYFTGFLLTGTFIKGLSSTLRKREEKKILDEVFSRKIFVNEEQALSLTAKIDYHVLKGIYYFRIGDIPMAYIENKKTISLLEDNPVHIRRDPLFYVNAMHNLISMQRSLGYDKEFFGTLMKLKNLSEEIGRLLREESYRQLRYSVYLNELAYYIRHGDAEAGMTLIKAENFIASQGNTMVEQYRTMINYYHAYISFLKGDLAGSLGWIGEIMNAPKTTSSENIQGYVRILNLLVHYEMQNFDLIEHLLRSTYYFMAKRNTILKYERIVLEYLGKILKLKDMRNLRALFTEARDKLNKIYKDPNEEDAFEHLDILSWLDSKIENRTMSEVMKEKVQKT
jgi:hypothetical protein